jgi:hypothetical protein
MEYKRHPAAIYQISLSINKISNLNDLLLFSDGEVPSRALVSLVTSPELTSVFEVHFTNVVRAVRNKLFTHT